MQETLLNTLWLESSRKKIIAKVQMWENRFVKSIIQFFPTVLCSGPILSLSWFVEIISQSQSNKTTFLSPLSLSITLSDAIEQDPENLCGEKQKSSTSKNWTLLNPFSRMWKQNGSYTRRVFFEKKNWNPDPGPTERFFSDLLKINYSLLL